MNRLLKIARSGTPGTGMQFCENAYESNGVRRFLRDVIAMANASVEGNRYIVNSITFDNKNQKQIRSIDRDDFSGKPSWQAPDIRRKFTIAGPTTVVANGLTVNRRSTPISRPST